MVIGASGGDDHLGMYSIKWAYQQQRDVSSSFVFYCCGGIISCGPDPSSEVNLLCIKPLCPEFTANKTQRKVTPVLEFFYVLEGTTETLLFVHRVIDVAES